MKITNKILAEFYKLSEKTIHNYRHCEKKKTLYEAMKFYYIQEGLKNETKQI